MVDIQLETIPEEWRPLYYNHQIGKKPYIYYTELSDDEIQKKIIEKYTEIRKVLASEAYEYGGGLYFKMAIDEYFHQLAGLRAAVWIAVERGLKIGLVPEIRVLEGKSPHEEQMWEQ